MSRVSAVKRYSVNRWDHVSLERISEMKMTAIASLTMNQGHHCCQQCRQTPAVVLHAQASLQTRRWLRNRPREDCPGHIYETH